MPDNRHAITPAQRRLPILFCVAAFFVHVFVPSARAETRFTVATFNVENYFIQKTDTRRAKPLASREACVQAIRSVRPDVLALQEIGGTPALEDLRRRLRDAGLEFPSVEHVFGWDTNIQVAILSRFPIIQSRSHTNESFVLDGRRFRVSRALIETDIQVTPQYRFTLMTAHLKSQRPVPEADQAEMRLQEAIRLRQKIDAAMQRNPKLNLVVCGDFNDHVRSPVIETLVGRDRASLIDTRPGEWTPGTEAPPQSRQQARRVTWTHFYSAEDSYSRLDYILLSRGMAREWQPEGTYVLATPDWGDASDHRPVVASFIAEDK